MRFITTYAGFTGESELLQELYDRGLVGEVIPELAHIENGEGKVACKCNGRTFVYWDHELKPHPGADNYTGKIPCGATCHYETYGLYQDPREPIYDE